MTADGDAVDDVLPDTDETPFDDGFFDDVIVDAAAAYTGLESAEGDKTLASFSGLVPGAAYVLIVTADGNADDYLAAENLLFIAQGAADENGSLSFGYIPRETVTGANVTAYGLSTQSLADASITVTEYSDGSFAVTVTYDGVILTEDEDYTLTVDDSDAASVTVTVTGRDAYAGTQTVTGSRIAVWTWTDAHTASVTVGGTTKAATVTAALSATTENGVTAATSYTDTDGNATNRVTYTASATVGGVTYTGRSVATGLFAGWYKDAACTVKYTSQPGANDVKYAKLVDPAVLTVKYQLKNPTYSTDTTSRMRIVTTVDSLDYASVGFIMSYPSTGTSTTRTLSTNRVYSKITGSGSIGSFNYKPTVFSTSSAYFCAYSMDLPAALFNTALHIQPMWTTADGTVVYGTARDITASGSASFVKA